MFDSYLAAQQPKSSLRRLAGAAAAALAHGGVVAALVWFSLGRPDVIEEACRRTAQGGLGVLREGDALLLHSALVERLPPQLRCYVGCATKLYGDVDTADVVKIHIRSGKLSLLYYDDFDVSPTPTLRQRVKIDFRTQRISFFDHSQMPSPQVLLMKSRYLAPEQAGYDRQRRFDDQLEALSLYPRDDYAPSLSELTATLQLAGYRISGFELAPQRQGERGDATTALPNLDDRAGRHFLFRDLCEAGETFATHRPDNIPTDAATYEAMRHLCEVVLDPVVEMFGKVEITYGFSGPRLSRLINARIDPRLDQHAGHERKRTGNLICERGGQAVDFRVPGVDCKTVADWVVSNTRFDRLYFYGADRPIHVSVGPDNSRQIVLMLARPRGRRVPRVVSAEKFLVTS
jgi:hypothetical protein